MIKEQQQQEHSLLTSDSEFQTKLVPPSIIQSQAQGFKQTKALYLCISSSKNVQIGDQQPNIGQFDSNAIYYDLQGMEELFRTHQIDTFQHVIPFNLRVEKDQTDLERELTVLFKDKEVNSILIYYNGHGNEKGEWYFETKTSRFNFGINNLLSLWDKRSSSIKHLLLILDSCHSGQWVKYLEQAKYPTVSVLASCRGDQTCLIYKGIGSFFSDILQLTYLDQHEDKSLEYETCKVIDKFQPTSYSPNYEQLKNYYNLYVKKIEGWETYEIIKNERKVTSCSKQNKFETILTILKKYQKIVREYFISCPSEIIIDDIFEREEENGATMTQLVSKEFLKERVSQTLFIKLSFQEKELLSIIKPLFGIYPRLKQWLFLRKPLSKFMNKIIQYFGSTYPFIKSISEQDIIILLCNMLPIDEMKILGECLANTYTPFPLIFKMENTKEIHFLDQLGYFQLAQQKQLVTYVHLSGITDEESIQICNELTSCVGSGNGFEGSAKSKTLTSNQSVLFLSKIPHQYGQNFAFAKISQFSASQFSKNDEYENIISSLLVSSSIFLIHVAQSDLVEFNKNPNANSSLKILLELIDNFEIKIEVFLISNFSEMNFQKNNESHCSIEFLDSSSDSLSFWKQILKIQPVYDGFDLSDLQPNNNSYKFQEAIGIYQQIEYMNKNLLSLNMLKKKIIDFNVEGEKLKTHYELFRSNNKMRDKNKQKKEQLEKTLKESTISTYVIKLLKYSFSQDLDHKSTEEINMENVFKFKLIICFFRGRSQDLYENSYILIASEIQKLEEELFEKKQYQNSSIKNQQEIELLSENIDILKEDLKFIDKEHQQNEITFSKVANEVIIALADTQNKLEDQQIEPIMQQFFKLCYNNSFPLQLIEGNTLQFGNHFLNEISKEIMDENITVISVIGLQSTTKSSLMNCIFQIDFSLENGFVKKGIYFTKIIFSGKPVIIVDSEGLVSLVDRHQSQNNLIMQFIFQISNIVIFNGEGEAIKQVYHLKEFCEQIIAQMQQKSIPNIIFTIRDYNYVQNEMIIKNQILLVDNIKAKTISGSMKLDTKNIIVFPPAFIEQQSNGLIFRQPNQIFAGQVLKLRSLIYQIMLENKTPFKSFQDFYKQGSDVLESLKANCTNLIIGNTLKANQDLEIIKIECDNEIQKQKKMIQDFIFLLINNLKLDYKNQQADLDSQIKQINIQFEKQIQIVIEPSQERVEQCATQCFEKYKLSDQKFIKCQMDLISSEFESFKQLTILNLSSKLLEEQMETEINILNENINDTILQELKNMKKDAFTTEQSIQSLKQKLKNMSKKIIQKLNEICKKKEKTMEIQLGAAWQSSVKRLKQIKKSKTIKIAFETFNPYKQVVNNYTTFQLYQNQFCLKLRKLVKIEKPLGQDKVSEFINKVLKAKNYNLERIKDLNWSNKEHMLQNWDQYIQLITEASYSSIKDTFKAENIASNQELKMQIILKTLLQEFQEIKQKKIEQIRNQLENQTQGIQQKIQQSIQNYKLILENADNAYELGKSYSKTLVKYVINSYQKEMDEIINENITTLLLDYENSEKNNEHAFAACFNEERIYADELIKFYLNTPKYIKENIRHRLKLPLATKKGHLKQIITGYFDNVQKCIVESLNEMIQTKKEMNASQFQEYFSRQLKQYLDSKQNSDLTMKIEHCEKDTEQKAFLNGILKEIIKSNQFISYANYSSDQYFDQKFNEKFQQLISNVIGCRSCCPHCGAKCQLQSDHSSGHDAKQTHRIKAYNRVTVIGSNELSISQCHNSTRHKWQIKGKTYSNVHEANQENYPEWVEHFRKLEYENMSSQYDENFSKRAYVLIGKWFENYFNQNFLRQYIAVIPNEWEQLLLPGERHLKVDINKKYPGYDNQFG